MERPHIFGCLNHHSCAITLLNVFPLNLDVVVTVGSGLLMVVANGMDELMHDSPLGDATWALKVQGLVPTLFAHI